MKTSSGKPALKCQDAKTLITWSKLLLSAFVAIGLTLLFIAVFATFGYVGASENICAAVISVPIVSAFFQWKKKRNIKKANG